MMEITPKGIEYWLNEELRVRLKFNQISGMLEMRNGKLDIVGFLGSESIEGLTIITALKFLELEHLTYDEIKGIKKYLNWFTILVDDKYNKLLEERTTKNND